MLCPFHNLFYCSVFAHDHIFQRRAKGNDLSQLLNVPNGDLIVNFILAGILLMSIAMNSVSYTAFSREGSTYWMSLTIPVERREQVNAKLMNCVAIETVFATLITVAFSLLFRRSLSDIVTVIALLVPAMIPPSV